SLSSSKYDKIGNYNLSYELLKEAVREFDGYVLGLSQNDIWLFADNFKRPDDTIINRPKIGEIDENLKKFLEDLSPRLLDRTTGTYFFFDLVKADEVASLNKYVSNTTDQNFPKRVMTFVPGYFKRGPKNKMTTAMRGFDPSEKILTLDNLQEITANKSQIVMTLNEVSNRLEEQFGVDAVESSPASLTDGELTSILLSANAIGKGQFAHFNPKTRQVEVFRALPRKSDFHTINDCLYYYDVLGLEKSNLLNKEGKEQYEDEEKKNPKMYYSDARVDSNFLRAPEINKQTDGVPDRFTSPSLGALVMQHPKASNASKGKDHLPIFFNAIPPIEMARCTPYIDIKLLTENYQIDNKGRKKKPSRMSNLSFMRFIKETDKNSNYFVLEDSDGFGDLKPMTHSVKDDEREATQNIDISYMDLFTSPQTFSNANLNRPNSGKFSELLGGNIEDDPILEPIMPFLSLESLTVSITGAGYGIMASKKASLKLVLHDRSRLRDLAPLVSPSQFSTTRILIEYGWNHPEGGPGSDNVIGKYLNSLKERSVFQVTKCDYDFSDGSAVSINVGLAAYGFRQTERVHCGAGPEVPLNVFKEYVEKITEDLIKNSEEEYGKDKAPEVRQKIKLNARSARSTFNSLSWPAYREAMKALKSKDPLAAQSIGYVFELASIIDTKARNERKDKILEELIDLALDKGNATPFNIFNSFEQAGLFDKDDSKETMLQRVYGKIKAFGDVNIPDPFLSSVVYGSKLQQDLLGTAGFENSEPAAQKKVVMEGTITMADEKPEDYVTLGKAIANFIGFPLAATCLYDEVQMIFYPLNHQSGGGRIHTTASLPIPIARIREEVQNAVKTSSNISVKRMFSLLERTDKDRNLKVYGIDKVYVENAEFNKKDEDEQLLTVLAVLHGDSLGSSLGYNPSEDEIDKEILKNYRENLGGYTNKRSLKEGNFSTKKQGGKLNKRLKKYLAEYRKQKAKAQQDALSEKLYSLYKDDGLSTLFPSLDRFVRPNISIDFEVVDAIKATPPGLAPGYKERFLKQLAGAKNEENGLYPNKTILRLHIYDEETVMSPGEVTLLSTMTEGTTGTPVIGGNPEKVAQQKTDVLTIAKSLTFNQAKQYIKRTYPTIIYGTAGSTVRSLGVSANTSGQMANILAVESYGNLRQAQVGGRQAETNIESVTLLPNTVSCVL
ncbi:MAG TPA: hypothetical protein DCM40_16950, partial [Maribacter sp.]|nr:hypothetical protein [Maribacter sp.]